MDDLLTRARRARACRDDLRPLVRDLPRSDDDLWALLRAAIAAYDAPAFLHLALAASSARRALPADVLATGGPFVQFPEDLAGIAARVPPDEAVGALVAVAEHPMTYVEVVAGALFTAAAIAVQRRAPVPPSVTRAARRFARMPASSHEAASLLGALHELAPDPGLQAVLPPFATDDAQRLAGMIVDALTKDPLVSLPDHRTQTRGAPAAPPVARNAACPCGSGKKYKNCHEESDRAAAAAPPPTPPLPNTADEAFALPGPDLLRLDLRDAPPDARRAAIEALANLGALERVAELLTITPDLDDVGLTWATTTLLRRCGPQAMVRLSEVVPEARWPVSLRFGLAVARGEDRFGALEAAARDCVDDPMHLALAVATVSPLVGVLLGRASMTVESAWDALEMSVELENLRDDLGLPAVDPCYDAPSPSAQRAPDHDDEPDPVDVLTQRLREAEAALDAERGRTRAEAAARVRAEAAARDLQHRLREAEARVIPAAAAEPEELRELRARLAEQKRELVDLHNERNTLRKELRAHETAAEEPASAEGVEADPDDDDDVQGAEIAGVQPIRMPTLPVDFAATLAAVPEAVARATLALIGDLAAGRATAYTGARPLRGIPDTWRQRVGRSYRLIFRPSPETLAVLDLVHRQELETRLRRLR